MKIKEKIIRKVLCCINWHEWTSAAIEGQKPTMEQIKTGVEGFEDYAKLYCKHCKKILIGR